MVAMEPRIAFRMLEALRVGDDRARRALLLAEKAVIVVDEPRRLVIAVPSQRRGVMPPRRKTSHIDLESLLRGKYSLREAETGKLAEEQQVYMVEVTPSGASCSCPDTVYNHDPLCIHKLAAAVVIADRLEPHRAAELLSWLPRAALRYRVWRRRRALRRTRKPEARGHERTSLRIFQEAL